MRKIAIMACAQPPPSGYHPVTLPPSPGAEHTETVSDQVIENRIGEVNYTVLTGDAVTICTVVLDTGYAVRGACTCADPRTFDPLKSRQCAYEEALRKLRVLFGFLAAESRHLYQANTWHLRGSLGET